MRYYRCSDDWISHLEGDLRPRLIATLRGLRLERLQKYPPPKITGLPIGSEARILSRFLAGKSSQLDASALSGIYRSSMATEDKLHYRAFRENDALTRTEWASMIGDENIDVWIENKLLAKHASGDLQCSFSIVSVDGLLYAADPLKDHGKTWEPDFLIDSDDEIGDVRPFHHTYIGLDSLRMIEAMEEMSLPKSGRYLDCGPGSGSLLLYFSRRYDEAIGVDINERAAALAQFNADLNGLANVKAYADDALDLSGKYGRFDLISWNLPFVFMPDEDAKDFIDGFGGELGIGICLEFIKALTEIMTESGMACAGTLAPIRNNGENVLESRLREMIAGLGLDCHVRVAQVTVAHNQELWDFHQSFGISKFESVYLRLSRGSGKMTRAEAPVTQRVIDSVRELLYKSKFGK